MSLESLDRASSALSSVLANVPATAYESATPCESWDVRALINHAVGAVHFFANAAAGTPPAADAERPDFTVGNPSEALSVGISNMKTAFAADGAMEATMKMPFGEMPGAMVAGLASTDMFTHAWDLAKATGQSTDLDPEFAEQLLTASKQRIQPGFRGENGKSPFTAEREAPASATAADRLAAFLGRNV